MTQYFSCPHKKWGWHPRNKFSRAKREGFGDRFRICVRIYTVRNDAFKILPAQKKIFKIEYMTHSAQFETNSSIFMTVHKMTLQSLYLHASQKRKL